MDLPDETNPVSPVVGWMTTEDSDVDESSAAPALPTMTDLDLLAADLDQVDHTLAALDGTPAV